MMKTKSFKVKHESMNKLESEHTPYITCEGKREEDAPNHYIFKRLTQVKILNYGNSLCAP